MGDILGELIVTISADITKLKAGLSDAVAAVQLYTEAGTNKLTAAQNSFGNSIQNVGQGLEKLGTSLRSTGRELNQLSGIFALTGAVGMAPFVLALHDSAQSIPRVGNALSALKDIGQSFYETLAQSVLPVIEKFTQHLNGLLQWFLNLPQPMRDMIAQAVLMNSIFLVMTGTVLKIGAEIVRFTSDVSKLAGKFIDWIGVMVRVNPVMLAIALAIGVLIALMIKFQAVGNAVMNTFEVVFRSLEIGFQTVAGSIEKALSFIYGMLAKVYDLMAKLPGPTQKFFESTADGAHRLSKVLDDMANKSFGGVITQTQKLGNLFKTGTGEWAADFQKIKNIFNGLFTAYQTGSDKVTVSQATWGQSLKATVSAFGGLESAMQSYSGKSKELAIATSVMAIGLAIVNTAMGVTDRLANREKFPWPVPAILAGIVAVAGAVQIATIASQGFAAGTDTVPAMLSPGEMIIPNTFADAIRKGNLTLAGNSANGSTNISNGGNNITINMQATIGSNLDISEVAKQIAFETNRELQYVRRRQR